MKQVIHGFNQDLWMICARTCILDMLLIHVYKSYPPIMNDYTKMTNDQRVGPAEKNCRTGQD